MRALAYWNLYSSGRRSPADLLQSMNRRFDEYCAEGGHLAAGTFPETSDNSERPRWDAMVSQIKESGLGYLVVVPSAAHLGATLEERVERVLAMDAILCKVVCDDPELPDPLQSAVSLERGTRGERIRAGMLVKAGRGQGLGKSPYGYRLQVDGSLRIVEEEAEIVRSMFQSYADGRGGVRAVAQDLNDRGLRTRSGKRWSLITVRDILRNTAYVGTYRRFGLRMPDTHDRIVTLQVFRQVQDLMRSRVPSSRSFMTKGDPFLLTGMIYCGHCGERMMGVTRRQTWQRKEGERVSGEYRYYQCQSRINRNQCAYRTVRAPEIEDEALSAVRALFPLDGEVDASTRAVRMAWQRKETERRLDALSRKYRATIHRASIGGINLLELRAAQEETARARRSLRERLARAAADAEDGAALIEDERDKLHYLWEDIDVAERRDALRTLVSRVVVTDGRAEVVP